MKSKILYILFVFITCISPVFSYGQSPNLRSTVSFAMFTTAGAFDNVGTSSITGNIGSKTYTPTGFPPGVISGSIYNASDGQSTLAATDVALLYDDLSRTPTSVISPTLGGQVLTAGVYSTGVGAAANLSGNITLDGQGDPNALFIIRIDGALGVSGSANVLLINSASPNNVFWQINGAFSLGISAVFRGTIVSAGAISLLSNSTLIGKGLTKAGAIDLNTSTVITKLDPASPTINITQPTCTVATGTITITAPAAVGMTYSIDGFNYVNTSGVFSSLTPGNYNVTAKDSDGFVSGITVATINTQPPTPTAPIVGAITQPTCTVATGSVQLSGLPLGNWTINPGAITGSGATTTINNLLAGTYNYTVTNSDGCTSLPSANILINTQPPTPTAPIVGAITQPTCTVATGSVQLSGLPLGNWTINPGAITGSGATTTINNLLAGTYNYTVTNSDGCTSLPSANILINTQPPTPTAPIVGAITQPTCTVATGSVQLSGLPLGNWTINPGAITGSGATTTINNDSS